MAYNQEEEVIVEIIETSIFTRRVSALLSPEEYRLLQLALLAQPDLGSVIPGSGGLRKVRWALKGRGKRGGSRVIYYWAATRDAILMLMIYSKNEQDDLTPGQLAILRHILEEEYP
ncbi:MAG TPA: type II toxin-antitoxin system RelE/ParE family toxin [Anaerolineaceae bacterium]|jgi:mRNA-degrading endonuclease RelE of RelBE toxin-antitoxin system|nr:type II toxin-antitoxin system RelE/ParE family toxin [Anaerolineaceae bacterium]HQJ04547.1 type II toxin-antitoxin system RelE/ParE family toxin [Anaerolineaceae bacterium]HQO98429.1 type II toxin-antitoxin system RelE/ParE family toxin [Anaerolineaceae bacterium]HQP61730.1 type II toxin-antitoxin system RelE/ParE family toxin [Anaerolineaceae bacterium]